MKLNCSRKDLVDAIGFVLPVTGIRSPQPLFQTIRFMAEGSQLRLTACNGETWAEKVILATVDTPGAVCVQGSLVQQLIASLPDGPVYLDSTDNQMTIRAGASDWKLMSFGADDFPSIPVIEASSKLALTHREISDAIDSVAYAASDEEIKPVLTGVLFRYDGSELVMVATDTKRLAVTKIVKEGIGSEIKAVVPERALRLVKALPAGEAEQIDLCFDANRISVEVGDSKIVSQLLEGTYPDWERVVPSQFTRSWTLDRGELIDNLRRIQILAKDSANRVRFGGKGEAIMISARSEDKGEAHEEIPAVMDNGEFDIAFNGKYVLEAVSALKGEVVVAEMTEPLRPALFRPSDESDGSRFCVIMPMALN